eukprot:scaffold1960_cov69-Cylindrotheca_fusiformis.AAC.2
MIFCNHQKQYVPNHPESNSNDWDSALLSNNKDNNNNPVRQCINRFTISWLDTVARMSAVVSMCASTVGSLSSGGSIGWTLATTAGVGTAFLANTASVKRNFEEARNELHAIAERMENVENGLEEARKERHANEEKMEKAFAQVRLSNIESQLRMERLVWHTVGPGAKIEIAKGIKELEEQKATLEREIGQLEALESGQERQVSGSANFIPVSPTNEMV